MRPDRSGRIGGFLEHLRVNWIPAAVEKMKHDNALEHDPIRLNRIMLPTLLFLPQNLRRTGVRF
jgi:hypothetical protein